MEAQLNLVHYYLDNELYENAHFIAERLHASNPQAHVWSHLRALSCLRLGKHALAAEFSRRAASDGEHLGCAYVHAQACLHLGKYIDGIEALEKAQSLYMSGPKQGQQQKQPGSSRFTPDPSAVNRLLGKLHKANGDKSSSADCFTAALKENPFMWDAFTELCDSGVKLSVPSIFKLREEEPNKAKNASSSTGTSTGTDSLEPVAAPGRTGSRQRKPLEATTPPHASQSSQSLQTSTVNEDPFDQNNAPNEVAASFQSQSSRVSKKRHRTGFSYVSTDAPEPSASHARKAKCVADGSAAHAPPRRSARLMKKDSVDESFPLSGASKENVKPVTKSKKQVDLKEKADLSTVQSNGVQSSASLVDKSVNKRTRSVVKSTERSTAAPPSPDKLPSLIGLLLKVGTGYYHLSRFDLKACLKAFSSLPVEQQSTPWVLSKTGRAHHELMAYKEAKTTFQALRKLTPAWLEDLEVYSIVLWHLKQDTELAYLAHELSDHHYLSPQAWCAVGNSFSVEKSHHDAIRAFNRASQLNPPCAQSFSLLGYEHVEMENYPEAATAFRRALQVDVHHYPAWVGLGRVHEKYGEDEKALEYFRRAEKINPSNAILMTYLARVLERTGKHGLALGYLRRAVGLNPPENIACLAKVQLANTHMRLDQPWEALKHLRWVEKCAPDESRVHLMLGRAYAMLGADKRGTALKCYTTALSLAPFSEEIRLAILDLEEESSFR